ncbi:hypothetical protein ACFWMG_28795 [Streptomyces sp. NPDC127074]|uniref:hypothetical protein n=1 Tax=Streptomyces sp. NPDC127074 TaxID=3347130 RepID=UPI003656A846
MRGEQAADESDRIVSAEDADDGYGHVSEPSHEERELMLRGFRLLPERSRSALWHTVVEGETSAQVSVRLGLTQDGATTLCLRARTGLRDTYLGFFARSERSSRKCRAHSGLLAAAVRQPGKRPGRILSRHLDACPRCRKAFSSLTDLDNRLRTLLPGAALGPAGPEPAGSRIPATAEAGAAPESRLRSLAGTGSRLMSMARRVLITAGVLSLMSFGAHVLQQHGTGPGTAPPSPAAPPPRATASRLPPDDTGQPTAPEQPPPSRPSGAASARLPATPVRDLPTGRRTTLEVVGSGRCLHPAAAGSAVGSAVCDGGADQRWEHLIVHGRDVLLRGVASGRCLRDRDGIEGDDQRRCDGADASQVWRVEFSTTEGSLVVVGAKGGRYAI